MIVVCNMSFNEIFVMAEKSLYIEIVANILKLCFKSVLNPTIKIESM